MRVRSFQRSTGAMAGLLLLAAPALAQEPLFEPGPVWTHAPPFPALPRSLAFVGPDHLWEAGSGASPSLTLLATGRGAAVELAALDPTWLAGASGPVEVAAGPTLDDTYVLAQIVTPVPGERLVRVLAVDPTPHSPEAPLRPRWVHDLDPTNGPAHLALAADGSTLLAGAHDARSLSTRVRRLDPATGSVEWERSWRSGGLVGPLVSHAGQRVLLATGVEVELLDASGVAIWTRVQSSMTTALALSADGASWAHGEKNRVLVWSAADASAGPRLELVGRDGELPVRTVLDPAGASVAVAWWSSLDATAVRLEWRATSDGALLAASSQEGSPTGVQNFPAALAMSPDGSRVALGLWGADDARPELLVHVRGEPFPRLAEDLGASVETLAIAPRSHRVAMARRADHANRLSLGGETRLLESDARDLVLRGAPRLGGAIDAVLAADAVDGAAWLLIGAPRAVPVATPLGWLALERRPAPLRFPMLRTAPESFEVRVSVPPAPELLGLEVALQAVRLGAPGPRLSSDAPGVVLF
jgi:hypothetical protein